MHGTTNMKLEHKKKLFEKLPFDKNADNAAHTCQNADYKMHNNQPTVAIAINQSITSFIPTKCT